MSRITGVAPPVPVNPPLGTTWRPEQTTTEKGPLAEALEPYLEIIRVRKTCRRCAADSDGWIFTATHQARLRRLTADRNAAKETMEREAIQMLLDTPYHVGLYRACGSCTADYEKRTEIAALETIVERTRYRWENATTLKAKLPAGRELAKHLERLAGLLRFGSDRFANASEQLDAVNSWLSEHRPAEVT